MGFSPFYRLWQAVSVSNVQTYTGTKTHPVTTIPGHTTSQEAADSTFDWVIINQSKSKNADCHVTSKSKRKIPNN